MNEVKGVDIPVRASDTALLFSDIHFKAQDRRFCEILVDFARDFRPTITGANGDILDFNPLSKHGRLAKEQVENGALEHEAEAAKPVMKALREATKDGGRTLWGGGNHEAGRWKRFLMDNPALAGMPWWDRVRSATEGWEMFDQGYEWYLGPLTVCHGDELHGSCTKYSTAAVAARYPRENLLYGHTHRIEHHTETIWSQGEPHEHGVWTTGHGQDISQVDWASRTRWRLGFATVLFWRNGRDVGFTVVQHEVFRVGKGLRMYSPLTNRTYKA